MGGFGLPKMLLTMDMFPAALPEFNSQGKLSIRTFFGGFISVGFLYVMFLYAVVKF